MIKKLLVIQHLFYFSLKCKENPKTIVGYWIAPKGLELDIYIGAVEAKPIPFFSHTYMISYKVYDHEESLVYGV